MAGRRETVHKPVIACEKRAQTGSSAVSPWNEECACRGERILVFQLTTGVFLLLGLKRPCLEQRVNFSRRTFHDRGRGAPATCTCIEELRKSLQPLPNIALRALRISVTVTSRLERNLNSNVIFATSRGIVKNLPKLREFVSSAEKAAMTLRLSATLLTDTDYFTKAHAQAWTTLFNCNTSYAWNFHAADVIGITPKRRALNEPMEIPGPKFRYRA